jgi:HAD superfamily hydrolase (TIGR01548 family)
MDQGKIPARRTIRNSERRSPAKITVPTLKASRKFQPELIIFDVDGVLVDVRGSFHRTTLETVRHFTQKRVTRHELQRWKNQSGFNDDWKLSTAWVRSLGGDFEYDEVKRKFVELYWGANGDRGHVEREKWLLPRASMRRLAARAELAIFTGRVRKELDYTLDRCGVREFFGHIVTAEDVALPKPAPEGLLLILDGRDAKKAIYVGDNVDDALAARAAGIPFVGIASRKIEGSRSRRELLRKCGAQAVLGDVKELEPQLRRAASTSGSTTSAPSTV